MLSPPGAPYPENQRQLGFGYMDLHVIYTETHSLGNKARVSVPISHRYLSAFYCCSKVLYLW